MESFDLCYLRTDGESWIYLANLSEIWPILKVTRVDMTGICGVGACFAGRKSDFIKLI